MTNLAKTRQKWHVFAIFVIWILAKPMDIFSSFSIFTIFDNFSTLQGAPLKISLKVSLTLHRFFATFAIFVKIASQQGAPLAI